MKKDEMMKKKLLFVIESLGIGGAEKSLVTLLNLMDYSKYDVDLLLFSAGGAFQSLLPPEVRLLPLPSFFKYSSVPWSHLGEKLKKPRMLLAQARYSIALRCGWHSNAEKAVLFWKAGRRCFAPLSGSYDVAIAYAQGIPTFYVADCVKAERKAAWINVTYKPSGKYLDYNKSYYSRMDTVNAVSESVYEQIKDTFGFADSKLTTIKDILDPDFARKMAEMPSPAGQDMTGSGVKILTVGRLAAMKGHSLAIDAAKILKENGIDFTWYAVGDGALRGTLEEQIKQNGLTGQFVLLGARSNPYPYYAACDLYVQSSRYEGFGITLSEAKMFRKPIVTTNFDAVGAQCVNEENALIVDISAEGIADGILRMLSDTELREHCVANLAKEKIGNREEIEKLYRMIEE